ncbi:MAG: hypothetical protein CMP83_10650 [Gammaproteobacteria bacterium]|nr:hypothetical protein [Gammaproteobacteria bacterium]
MAINFPSSPYDGEEYTDSNSGTWVYDSASNSWSLKAAGNTSPFDYRGGWDFASGTAPTGLKSGDLWTHEGADGATINGVYTGMSGTIAKGQMVLYDGSKYVKVGSTPGYPNTGDGEGATLDDRYLKLKGRTSQTVEGSTTTKVNVIAGDYPNAYSALVGTGGIDIRQDSASVNCFTVYKGGVALKDITLSMKSDGSISAAGSIDCNTKTLSQNGVYLMETGTCQVRQDNGTVNAFEIYQGGNAAGNIKASITGGGSGHFKGDVAVGTASTFRTIAAVVAALPEDVRTKFADALASWESAGTLDLEDPTTLPADVELREAIIRATTAGKVNLNGDDGTVSGGTFKTSFLESKTSRKGDKNIALWDSGEGTERIVFKADGSITAAGNISITPDNGVTNLVFLSKDGKVAARPLTGTSNVWEGLSSSNAVTSEISSDGSITAAGDNFQLGNVDAGEHVWLFLKNKSERGIYLNKASDDVLALTTNSSNIGALNQPIEFNGNTGNITAAGSGVFGTDSITIDGVSTRSKVGIDPGGYKSAGQLVPPSVCNYLPTGYEPSRITFGNYYGSGADTTFKVTAGGSITARGDAIIGPNPNGSLSNNQDCVYLGKEGYGTFIHSDTTSTPFITCNQTGAASPLFEVEGNGNVTAAGTVTAPNVTFNLEPENEANYEVSTETYTETEYIEVPVVNKPGTGTADIQDGVSTADLADEPQTQTVAREVEKTREVKTYVGPTMNLLETVQSLLNRATAQDAVIEDLTTQLAALKEANS